MFPRITRTIALQFTAFVFLLFLVNGAVFLGADFENSRRGMHERLLRSAGFVLEQSDSLPEVPLHLPPMLRERVRVSALDGTVFYAGAMFEKIPFRPDLPFMEVTIEEEDYVVATIPVEYRRGPLGYLEVADFEHVRLRELPFRALLYLFVSLVISGLTFVIGRSFAKRSLKPAEEMFQRLEQFTQDASHELRTPLAVLNSSLDVALKTKNYREGILSAKDDVKAVSALVERLLELTRLDKFTLRTEPVDLSALAEESVEKFRMLAKEKHVRIVPEIAPGVTAEGDGTLLRQVLGNLLSNAIKFNKPKGTVTVRLTPSELTVSDTGIGLRKQSLAKIFDRFYQADPSRSEGGFGLGLALVKRIIDLHGWSIAADGDEGEGATFTVSFRRS